MRKRNKVKQLNRSASHRRAMLRNMAVSLLDHERIVTTRARSKVLRSYAEKLITRARHALDESATVASKLHNRREVMKDITNEAIVAKLFGELATRYKERPGGYTRIIHLPERQSDSASMSIIELVDRKEKKRRVKAAAEAKAPKPADESKAKKADTKSTSEKGGIEKDKGKWWRGFRKQKGDDHSG